MKVKGILIVLALIVALLVLYAYQIHPKTPVEAVPQSEVRVVKVVNMTGLNQAEGNPNQAYYVYLETNGTIYPSQVTLVTAQGGYFPPTSLTGRPSGVSPIEGEGYMSFVIPQGETLDSLTIKENGYTVELPLPSPSQSISEVVLHVVFSNETETLTLIGQGKLEETLCLSSQVPLNVSGYLTGKVNVTVPNTTVEGKTKVPVYLNLGNESQFRNITLILNVTYGFRFFAYPIKVDSNISIFNVTVINEKDEPFYLNVSQFLSYTNARTFPFEGLNSTLVGPKGNVSGLICFPGKVSYFFYKTKTVLLPVPLGKSTTSFSEFKVYVNSSLVESESNDTVVGFSGEEVNFTVYLYNPGSVPLSLEDVISPFPLSYVHALLLPNSGEDVTFQGILPDFSIYGKMNITLVFLKV